MYFQVIYKNKYNVPFAVIMYADHASEAISNVMDDYPDVNEIISCKQLR